MKIPELDREQYVAFIKKVKKYIKTPSTEKIIWGPTFDNPHLLIKSRTTIFKGSKSIFIFIFPRLKNNRNYITPGYSLLYMIYTSKDDLQRKIAKFENIPPIYEIKAAFAAAVL